MKITYTGHSGFLVETDNHLLLFDYYTGNIPPLSPSKPLLVFASHHHPDHFRDDIASICAAHPAVTYVLSDDIRPAKAAACGIMNPTFVSPGHTCTIAGCRFHTLSSTDCGVAFLVQADGKHIYHAGDLNLWLWAGMDKSRSLAMMKRYMAYTEPLRGEHIDVAFLTLDNRQGEAAFCNIDYFLRHFSIDLAIPMHYFGPTTIADRLLADPSSEPYRQKLRKMEEGETLQWV